MRMKYTPIFTLLTLSISAFAQTEPQDWPYGTIGEDLIVRTANENVEMDTIIPEDYYASGTHALWIHGENANFSVFNNSTLTIKTTSHRQAGLTVDNNATATIDVGSKIVIDTTNVTSNTNALATAVAIGSYDSEWMGGTLNVYGTISTTTYASAEYSLRVNANKNAVLYVGSDTNRVGSIILDKSMKVETGGTIYNYGTISTSTYVNSGNTHIYGTVTGEGYYNLNNTSTIYANSNVNLTGAFIAEGGTVDVYGNIDSKSADGYKDINQIYANNGSTINIYSGATIQAKSLCAQTGGTINIEGGAIIYNASGANGTLGYGDGQLRFGSGNGIINVRSNAIVETNYFSISSNNTLLIEKGANVISDFAYMTGTNSKFKLEETVYKLSGALLALWHETKDGSVNTFAIGDGVKIGNIKFNPNKTSENFGTLIIELDDVKQDKASINGFTTDTTGVGTIEFENFENDYFFVEDIKNLEFDEENRLVVTTGTNTKTVTLVIKDGSNVIDEGWYFKDNYLCNSLYIPEPAEYAMFFGIFALLAVYYSKRK